MVFPKIVRFYTSIVGSSFKIELYLMSQKLLKFKYRSLQVNSSSSNLMQRRTGFSHCKRSGPKPVNSLDSFLKQILKGIFRRIETLAPPRRKMAGRKVYSYPLSNDIIKTAIISKKPFLLSRLGTTETAITRYFIENNGKDFPAYLRSNLCTLSGFYPDHNNDAFEKFCSIYAESIKKVDLMGVRADRDERDFWDDEEFLLAQCKNDCQFINLRFIEPFSYKLPWTLELADKRVLVIHPYEDSIKSQYNRINLVFQKRCILPDFKLITIRAVQSLADSKMTCGYDSFFSALEDMQRKISQCNFDIALIGAGAYGLPLAAYCKSIGKQAVHVGGVLQVFFGIHGKRWVRDKTITRHVNEFWVAPSKTERPSGCLQVEDGCYWL